MNKVFAVFAYRGDTPIIIGHVKADNQVLADRKARNLYGPSTWTKERDRVASHR